MTRVAIYARYSSDLQTDASIEDQIRICKQRAEREGWKVVEAYTDHGISGASLMRPGVQMLMQDAQNGKFDIILAEALDRLSRDQEDIAGIYKRLEFAGVKIVTQSEGEVSTLHIGLKGTMNAMFLKDLADKTRRGISGRVEKGKSGGGRTFGYDVVKKFDANGEPVRGDRKINAEQAEIVRRIFSEYVAGKSPLNIAKQLNAEGIKGPSGKAWGPSTINGNRERGTGVLNNELYIGRLVWNRLRYIKNPDTGKRISRQNPPDEWIIKDVPELAIIEQELWDAVRQRQGKIKKQKKSFRDCTRPRYLLSRLIKCGSCGGGMSMVSQTHIGCSTARNKGTCSNRKTIARDKVESIVLSSLQEHLMDESLCGEFCDEYVRHMNALRHQHNASLGRHQAEHARIKKQLSKMVDAIADGAEVALIKDKLWELENRRIELEEILADKEEAPVLFHPGMATKYHREVRQLVDLLNEDGHRPEAAELLRTLVEKVVLTQVKGQKDFRIDLIGDLAGILNVATGKDITAFQAESGDLQVEMVAGGRNQQNLRNKKGRPIGAAQLREMISQVEMVAGVGFEPTTFRL